MNDQRSRVQFPAEAETFLFTVAFRWALRFAHPPAQWIPGVLSATVKLLGVKHTTSIKLRGQGCAEQ
jgi:hypothetical protein